MGKATSWTCPTCNRPTTLSAADRYVKQVALFTGTSLETQQGIQLSAYMVKCPNPSCGALQFSVQACNGLPREVNYGDGRTVDADLASPVGIGRFQFLPTTTKPLSADVPAAVQEDYREAWLIRSLSPKASATLARRALQGMIRDFWQVSKRTLADELSVIEQKCDPALYAAMMGLKSIGNIGAHPERDVSLMIDIEQDEAEQLLELIHLLDGEWYIARANRAARLAAVSALALTKRAPPPAPTAVASPAPPPSA